MKKRIDLVLIIISCALMIGLGAAFWLLPDKAISEKENRTLAKRPAFSMSNLLSGKFTADMGAYYADQFPARDALIGIKAYAELSLFKGENNGVLLTNDHYLIPRTEKANESQLAKNIHSVSVFADAVDAPVYVVPLPRPVDVFSDKLPVFYPKQLSQTLFEQFEKLSEQAGLSIIDLYDPLCDSNYYYRTDHHYTSDGAFLCYRLMADTVGYTAFDKNYFTPEIVSQNFCGTSMRTSGFYLTPEETITLYRYENDDAYEVTVEDDGSSMKGLYHWPALSSTDQYAVFLGGNHALARVTLPGADSTRPKLLMIRDSFADSILPFLANHYDITLIDLRYYKGNVQKLVAEEAFDAILIYQCLSEFDQNNGFSYLEIPYKQE